MFAVHAGRMQIRWLCRYGNQCCVSRNDGNRSCRRLIRHCVSHNREQNHHQHAAVTPRSQIFRRTITKTYRVPIPQLTCSWLSPARTFKTGHCGRWFGSDSVSCRFFAAHTLFHGWTQTASPGGRPDHPHSEPDWCAALKSLRQRDIRLEVRAERSDS